MNQVKELFCLYILGILASLFVPVFIFCEKKIENGVFPPKLGSKFGFLCPIDFFLSFYKQKTSVAEMSYLFWHSAMLIVFFYLLDVHTINHRHIGGFHLVDFVITELKDHMICYKLECSHWWKIYL